jgi:uncharacterized protein YllA (UPF0747 family)
LAARAPERFSPAAALRPVLQDLVFPVAATVLGPGEMAYWSQLGPLHDHHEAVWPMIVPRASFTLVDRAGEKALRKLRIGPADLFLSNDELRRKVLQGGAIGRRLEEGTARILGEIDKMQTAVREVDRGLDPLFSRARDRINREMLRVAEKTQASIAQRENAGVNRLAYLKALVRPRNRPQERALCTAQFAAGQPTLATSLLEALDPFAFEHRVVGISP